MKSRILNFFSPNEMSFNQIARTYIPEDKHDTVKKINELYRGIEIRFNHEQPNVVDSTITIPGKKF